MSKQDELNDKALLQMVLKKLDKIDDKLDGVVTIVAVHDEQIKSLQESAKENAEKVASNAKGIKADVYQWIMIMLLVTTIVITIIFNLK